MLLQCGPFCRHLFSSAPSSIRPGCAWGDVLGQEVLKIVFEGLAHEYGDVSSPAGPGTVLSLAEAVMALCGVTLYSAGPGIVAVIFPLQRLFERHLLRGFSLEQLSLVLNIGALGLTTERGFMCMKACLLFPPSFPKHGLSHISAVLRSSCPK